MREYEVGEKMSLREQLASLEHEQWAHWTRWQIDNASPEANARWERQIATPYAELSEREKDSDRVWADKVLALVTAATEAPVAEQEPAKDAPVLSRGVAASLLAQYHASLLIRFERYYKYAFEFFGETEAISVHLTARGHHRIYRYSVDRTLQQVPATLEELEKNFEVIRLTNKATGAVYEWIDDDAW